MDNESIDHEDVSMRLFTSSLTEEALDWFKGIYDNHITTYDAFSFLFKRIWLRKGDGRTLGTHFNQIKKQHNETLKEFISRFERLYNQIPTDYHPTTSSIRLLYMNSFEGKFRYILKYKSPTSLAEAKEFSIDIDDNLLYSKIEPFKNIHNKTESRTKVSKNSALDLISLLNQKIDQMNTHFFQVKDQLMNRMNTMERNQYSPRHHFSRQQRDATGWKLRPQQEAKAPDTLKPVGKIDIEAWCLPCQEPHREDE
jgi:hypothetical protein